MLTELQSKTTIYIRTEREGDWASWEINRDGRRNIVEMVNRKQITADIRKCRAGEQERSTEWALTK
jgi:hypothetical protein